MLMTEEPGSVLNARERIRTGLFYTSLYRQAAFGVDGGFLLVPFARALLCLPMYVNAGTSALAITLHSVTSIANYVRLGAQLDYA